MFLLLFFSGQDGRKGSWRMAFFQCLGSREEGSRSFCPPKFRLSFGTSGKRAKKRRHFSTWKNIYNNNNTENLSLELNE